MSEENGDPGALISEVFVREDHVLNISVENLARFTDLEVAPTVATQLSVIAHNNSSFPAQQQMHIGETETTYRFASGGVWVSIWKVADKACDVQEPVEEETVTTSSMRPIKWL